MTTNAFYQRVLNIHRNFSIPTQKFMKIKKIEEEKHGDADWNSEEKSPLVKRESSYQLTLRNE